MKTLVEVKGLGNIIASKLTSSFRTLKQSMNNQKQEYWVLNELKARDV